MKSMILFVLLGSILNFSVSANDDVIKFSASPNGGATLGMGFDVDKQKFVGECLLKLDNAQVEYVGAQVGVLNYSNTLSQRELADSLGFTLGARARFGVAQASLAASFAKSASSNDYSQSIIFKAEIHAKNVKRPGNRELSPVGIVAKGSSDQKYVWENWREACGHKYVSQIKLGAMILISAKFEFASKADKEEFDMKFNLKSIKYDLSATLNKASKSFSNKVNIVISAYQQGGNVSELGRIFGTGEHVTYKPGHDKPEVHAILACSLSNFDPCNQILTNALKYAYDKSSGHGFFNQIDTAYNQGGQHGLAELEYILRPWSSLSYFPPPPLIEKTVAAARAHLNDLFEKNYLMQTRIFGIESAGFRLSPRQKNNLDKDKKIIQNNIDLISRAAMNCYDDALLCQAELTHVTTNIQTVDEEDLNIYPESLVQFCDCYKGNNLSRSLFKIMENLINLAGPDLIVAQPNDNQSYCNALSNALIAKKEINLPSIELEDVSLLTYLINLEKLNLRNNKISDISFLGNLKKLRTVNLDDNNIENVSSFEQLSELREVYLQGNNIEEIPDLSRCEKLNMLDVGFNRIKKLENLNKLRKLKNLRIPANKLNNLSTKNFQGLKYLENLNLEGNFINDFSFLKELENLEFVNIFKNTGDCPEDLNAFCLKGF